MYLNTYGLFSKKFWVYPCATQPYSMESSSSRSRADLMCDGLPSSGFWMRIVRYTSMKGSVKLTYSSRSFETVMAAAAMSACYVTKHMSDVTCKLKIKTLRFPYTVDKLSH